ncbi:hypothetical protein PHYBOEH_010411 [Phytophthora boehmeriae]|uniref:M96 mating-specific protein family n=1 Tax=Phytophthora boehmeriae TaxID=109152 RepID=A0A8T1VRA2_9STRA|nr:hypothetical protein PHYBOEH_010411 [Phytophthora boehmeriae]
MSFLGENKSIIPSLEEIVATIDAHDDGENNGNIIDSKSEDIGSPFGIEDMESILLDSFDDELKDEKLTVAKNSEPVIFKQKKKKRTPGSSTRLQRRKKAEILALREQASELEARLTSLQQVTGKVGESSMLEVQYQRNDGALAWQSRAGEEYQKRLQSETTNRKLRKILVDNLPTIDIIGSLLREYKLNAPMWLSNSKELSYPALQQPLNDNKLLALIGQLEDAVATMYLNTNAVFKATARIFLSNELTWKKMNQCGRLFEITTMTPVPCSMLAAADLVWKEYLIVRKYSDKFYRFFRQRKTSSIEKCFVMTLRSGSIQREINGVAFTRKIEEPNRIVLVEADYFFLPTEALRFRMQSWTVITPQKSELQETSVVRSVLQFFPEYAEGFFPLETDLRDIENMVLGTLSERVRAFLQTQQAKLLQDADLVRKCPSAASY